MARLFLNSDNQNVTISNPMNIYGAGGSETIFIDADTTGVVVDQNVERVDLSAASSAFTFQQAGNTLKVYQNSVLTATIPVQDDDNGTQLVFTDGSVEVTLASASLFLGGEKVPETAAEAVIPKVIDTDVTSVSTGSMPLTGKAPGMFLDSWDTNIIISDPMNIYGAGGSETIFIAADTTGVVVDQNVERIDLSAASSAFTFQQEGNTLKVYQNSVLTATIPVQDDDNGTQLVFTDGSVEVTLASEVLYLGGAAVPAKAAASVTPKVIDDTVTPGSTPFTKGIVTDGYLKEATVFADANGDGIWNEGEAKTTTDLDGNFTLTGGIGTLIATGGIDISTGIAFEGTFTAPSGSTTVSPLSSLVDQVMQNAGITAAQASSLVAKSLGLSETIDLLTFDPIAAAKATGASNEAKAAAIDAQAASVKIVNTMSQAAAMLAGAGIASEQQGAVSAAAALADMMVKAAATGTPAVDLTSPTTIESFLQASATRAGATQEQTKAVQAVSEDIAFATANINTSMGNAVTNAAPGATPAEIFTQLAQNQVAAEAIEIMVEAAAASGNAGDVVIAAEPDKFAQKVADSAGVVKEAEDTANNGGEPLPDPDPDPGPDPTPDPGPGPAPTPPAITYSATTFTEADANDGSITTTITITLANDTFTGSDGSPIGTVDNVPAGLTAHLVRASNTTATLSFTGKATAHGNAQDINNLTVTFADGDFTGGNASIVAGATTNNLVVDFADPAAPVFNTISVDNLINAAERTAGFDLTGKGEAGATITVTSATFTNEKTADVDANGDWTIAVRAGELTADGETVFSATQTDAAGNVSAVGTTTVTTDSTAPTVSSVAIDSAAGVENNYLNAGDEVSVKVTLSEATRVDTTNGTPQLSLNIGGATVMAEYASGSGSTDLVFKYTIQDGQTDADGISIDADALSLNGGTLADAAGNGAALTHAAVTDNAGYMVDTTAPTAPAFDTISDDNIINGAEETAGFNLTGTGEAGATITITGSVFAGGNTAVVNESSTWTMAVAAGDLTANTANELFATQTDAAGNVSEAGTTTITTDSVAAPPAFDTISDDNLINAEEEAGFSLTGTGEAGATITVTGAAFTGGNTAVVDGTGAWTMAVATGELTANGETVLSATQTDVAGNVSEAGTTTIITDLVAATATDFNQNDLDKNGKVSANDTVVMTFSEKVSSLGTVGGTAGIITGVLAADGLSATFTLTGNETDKQTITLTGMTDVAGNISNASYEIDGTVRSLEVSVDANSGIVTFGGNAEGEITISWAGTVSGSVATFARGGIVADVKPDFSNIGTARKITLDAGQTLSATAGDVKGVTIDGEGSVIVTEIAADSDLSPIKIGAGALSAEYSTASDVTFTGNIVGATAASKTLNIAESITFTSTADRLTGLTITDSDTKTANVTVTDLEATSDFSKVDIAGDLAVTMKDKDLNFTGDIVNATAASKTLNIATDHTLTSKAAKLTGLTITDTGKANVTVTDLEADSDFSNIDIAGNLDVTMTGDDHTKLEFTGDIVNARAGSKTLNIEVEYGVLKIAAAELEGLTITGSSAPKVTITEITATTDLRCINIGPYGQLTAEYSTASDVIFTGNIVGATANSKTLNIATDVTFTSTADRLENLIITDSNKANVTVTEITATTDLKGIQIGGNLIAEYSAASDVTFTGNIIGETAAGSKTLNIAKDVTFTSTADRLTGLTITDSDTKTANVTVTDIAADTDLSGVNIAGDLVVEYSASENLTFDGKIASATADSKTLNIAENVTFTGTAAELAGVIITDSNKADVTVTGVKNTQDTTHSDYTDLSKIDIAGTLTLEAFSGTDNVIDATGFKTKANTIVGNPLLDFITGGEGADTLTGGGSVDTFIFAAGDSLVESFDKILDFNYGSNDYIKHSETLSIGGTTAAATSGVASISGAGLATFHNDDDTFAERVTAVAASLDVKDGDKSIAGKVAFFEHKTNSYVFITDNDGTNTFGDDLIELTGVINLTTITFKDDDNTAIKIG